MGVKKNFLKYVFHIDSIIRNIKLFDLFYLEKEIITAKSGVCFSIMHH